MRVKITTKGQITLPKQIVDHLHVIAGDQLDFSVDDKGVVSIASVVFSIKELKGFLPKPNRPVTLDEMEQTICSRGWE
ncbi:MAG: AbrB/MazE/SpoVT family DNA-binding domain-containing protein [Pseudomonadales bacterium]|nr:AbrB/MazE/SpoVT family DNA-binding domain-containing protein [Pseudomonadales bacterium]